MSWRILRFNAFSSHSLCRCNCGMSLKASSTKLWIQNCATLTKYKKLHYVTKYLLNIFLSFCLLKNPWIFLSDWFFIFISLHFYRISMEQFSNQAIKHNLYSKRYSSNFQQNYLTNPIFLNLNLRKSYFYFCWLCLDFLFKEVNFFFFYRYFPCNIIN